MAGLNKVMLIGYLGKDPEVKHLDGGATVCNFSIATSESWKDKEGNKKESTEWHNVVLWRNLAEIAEKYLRKGMQIYLEGKIKTRSWDDAQGTKRYTTEILGDTFTMLGSKKDNETGERTTEPKQNTNKGSDKHPLEERNDKDDLPF